MKESSNLYALAALRERRAEIAGEITSLEERLRYLRQAVEHVDGALALFDPDGNPALIKPKKPYHRVKLFGAGKLNRLILDALREATGPLSTAEVVERLCAGLSYGEMAAKGMRPRIRSNLHYLWKVRGLVVKEGERETALWAVVRPPGRVRAAG